MERVPTNALEPPVTRRSLRRAPAPDVSRARLPVSDARPVTRRDLRRARRRTGPALVIGEAVRLASPRPRSGPGRHAHPPRSRHRAAQTGPGHAPAFGLAASVLLLTFAIGGVHSDLNDRQERQSLQARVELVTRIDRAGAERLSAQAEQYAAGRHAAALDAALAAMEDAGVVVVVATGIVDAEVVSPLDQAVAELAALVETAAPSALTEPRTLLEEAVDGDLLATSAPRGASVDPVPTPSVPTPAPGPAEPLLNLPDLQVSDRMLELAAQVAELTGHVRALADAALVELAAAEQAAAEAAAAEAAAAEAAAAERARKVSGAAASPNGAIPRKLLCGVGFTSGVLLRCDAAAALEELNGAFRARFGRDLSVSSSYRDYAAQVTTKEYRGSLAAEPGTSNHGRGLAVDFNGFGVVGQFDRPYYLWMKENAGSYGWIHPPYMGPGGSGPLEPWHWEYGTL